MVKVKIPYGEKYIELTIPRENLLGVLEPRKIPPLTDPVSALRKSLRKPLNKKPLKTLVKPGDKVAIVIDDITRPLPSKVLLPVILEELEQGGVKREDITIIIATGIHRPITEDEAKYLMGDLIAKNYRWVNHDCDSYDLVFVGKTRFGNEVYINRIYAEADVKIIVSDVTLHYYAGYGGGPKSIVPGIAGRKTIYYNHSFMFKKGARIGSTEGNPVFEDIMEGAKLAGVDFTVCVVLNARKEIIGIFSGDLEAAFYSGVQLLDKMCKIPIKEKADIVISSPGGFPFDINLYQAHKGLYTAEYATKDGGTIFLIAECRNGFGNDTFITWMKKYWEYEEIMKKLKKRFILGAHKAFYVKRAVSRYRIYLYSSLDENVVRNILGMIPTENVQTALFNELKKKPNAKILVMPYATETLPILKNGSD